MSNLAPPPNGIAGCIPGFALFKGVSAALERLGIEFWLARANQPLRDLLQATSLTKQPGKENIFPSVRTAVMAYCLPSGAQQLLWGNGYPEKRQQ